VDRVRPVLALLGGIAISAAGLAVVLGSDLDLPGVVMITAGALVAAFGLRSPVTTEG
jgi:hypothetical protein